MLLLCISGRVVASYADARVLASLQSRSLHINFQIMSPLLCRRARACGPVAGGALSQLDPASG